VPYIGKQLVRGQNRKLDDISSGFNGSQTTFTLQVAGQNVGVGSALQLWISLGGVVQEPLSTFTIAGSQITFVTAPAASLDFFGVIQGDVTDTNTPGDATVTTSKLATGLTVNLADGSAATSSLQLGGTDSGLFSSAADKVNVTTGGVERLEIGSSEVVFNDGSNDVDFRVESNGQTHMLFVDGGNDNILVGTSSAASNSIITVRSASPHLSLYGSPGSNTSQLNLGDTDDHDIGNVSYDHSDNSMRFTTNAAERLRIDSSGNIRVTGTRGGSLQPSDNDSLELYTSATSGSANTGTGLTFYNHDSSGFEMGGTIQVAKENGTANNTSSYMRFSTRANGSSAAERLRIQSSGGISFNGDTAAANALDDYEEGTWTPVPSDGSNTSTISAIQCRYTKIGRLVYIRGSLLNINTTGMTSGNTISITGLPFALAPNVTNARCAFPVATDAITTTKGVVASISENSTSFQLYEVDDAVYGTSIKVSALVHGDADIWVNFSYETA